MTVDLSEFSLANSTKCALQQIIDTLSSEDAEKMNAALLEDTIPIAGIIRFLLSRDIRTSEKTVGLHRRNECRCTKDSK